MSLPNVLLIGAMKAGSTTVYFDLVSHPDVFDADLKEVDALATDEVLAESGLAGYRHVYRNASPRQVVVDASTSYSKRPRIEGVPERAVRVLPSGFKVVYVVREPVSRAVSHHRHIIDSGHTRRDFSDELDVNSDLVDFGRYGMQIRPWLDAIGRDRVHVVRTEDYVNDRKAGAEAIQDFLGLEPRPDLVDPGRIRNLGEGKAIHNSASRFIASMSFYRRFVRPLIGGELRSKLKRLVMTRSTTEAVAPSAEDVERILEATAEDRLFIEQFLDSKGAGAHAWDPEVIRQRYRSLRDDR